MTELCDIAFKYGTDKCPQIYHTYTPFYYDFFKDRRTEIKKVLEFGIGLPYMGRGKMGIVGASLRMWRDFFPNAQIYGVDILEECRFEDERIQTFILDERDDDAVIDLINTIGADIDIVIDDANHSYRTQAHLCWTLLPVLHPDVTYIIEDVRSRGPLHEGSNFVKSMRRARIDFWIPPIDQLSGKNCLVVVRPHKEAI